MNTTASSHGIQRPSQCQVWYCQAGTADSSCCQQSFFSGPNLYRSPADPSRQQNHLQGEMTAEQTALWCCSGWNPNVRALNLVFPSVSSLSQCLLVFPSVLWSLPASLVNPSRINMKSVAEVAILVRLKDSYDHQTVRSSGFIRSIKPGILLKSQVSSFKKKLEIKFTASLKVILRVRQGKLSKHFDRLCSQLRASDDMCTVIPMMIKDSNIFFKSFVRGTVP